MRVVDRRCFRVVQSVSTLQVFSFIGKTSREDRGRGTWHPISDDCVAPVRSALPHIDPVLCFGGCPNFWSDAHSWDTARRSRLSQKLSSRLRSRDETVSEVRSGGQGERRFPGVMQQSGPSRATGLATLTPPLGSRCWIGHCAGLVLGSSRRRRKSQRSADRRASYRHGAEMHPSSHNPTYQASEVRGRCVHIYEEKGSLIDQATASPH